MERKLWVYHPHIIEGDGPRVTVRGMRWRRVALALIAASVVFLGLWPAVWGISGSWHPSPIVMSVLLGLLAGLAWLSDVAGYTLTLDGETCTYELNGGWPWFRVARRGGFADLLRLRLQIERGPRRFPGMLLANGKWLLPPRFGHRGWLVLYLDIQGQPDLAFQIQSSVVPAAWFARAGEGAASMRGLLLQFSNWLRIPAIDATSYG